MFSELLEQCKQVFKSADISIKDNKKILQQSRALFPSNDTTKLDYTKSFGNAVSFTKTQRFKTIQKEELNLNDISFCQTEVSQAQNQKNKCFTFTKSQRFFENKLKQKQISQSSVLYPNYDVVKRNITKAPIMKLPINKDLSKSNISQATAASLTQVGPGKYFVSNIDNEPRKSTAFSKQKRFKKEKLQYEDNPLFINENQTKKRPPSAAMMKRKIVKNAKLISKEQQQQMRERLKMIYWQSIPLELDRLFKHNIGPILRQNYFNIKTMTGRQKRCAMLMMLDRLNYLRGGFEHDLRERIQQKNTLVVYRKSTPKPFKFSQNEPGPDFYYPHDDIIKPTPIGFSFAKQGVKQRQTIYDDRDYEINEQIFKKGGNIIINPIHKQHVLTIDEIRGLDRGPGFYDVLFGQVEKRTDVGAVKYVQISQKNARENNCVDVKKDINDAIYFPSYSAIDPNVSVPLYRQNANVKPMHLPDKILFPEHWLFYDGDLNKVRAEIAKNVILAKNMDFDTYKIYTKRFQAFKVYLKSRQPIPDVGEYNIKFNQIDPHVEGFEMDKKSEKTLIEPIVKQQGDVEGDNLLLNPAQLKKHLPTVEFSKMIGRPQEQINIDDDEPKQGDRLLLNPQPIANKLPQIKFDKMQGRVHPLDNIDPDEPQQGNVLILDPKPIEKHLQNIDFSKQPQKQQPQISQLADIQEILILEPKPIQKKIKGSVKMDRVSAVKLVPKLREKNKINYKKQGSIYKEQNMKIK